MDLLERNEFGGDSAQQEVLPSDSILLLKGGFQSRVVGPGLNRIFVPPGR